MSARGRELLDAFLTPRQGRTVTTKAAVRLAQDGAEFDTEAIIGPPCRFDFKDGGSRGPAVFARARANREGGPHIVSLGPRAV
ncbi:MAG: hypothetical protein ACOY5V_07400 [Pseudomonadota bacterium]